jgi:hypothetical protein
MRFELPTLPTRTSLPSIPSIPSLPSLSVLPSLPADVSAKLTEAGHTAVGFAAMAAKQANDSRLELNARFEPQVRDLRKNAVGTIKSVSAARAKVADTVDPIVDRLIERLPDTMAESVAESVAEVRKVSRQAVGTVEQRVIDAIEFATAIPTKAVRRTPAASAASATTSGSTTKTAKAAKATATKTSAKASATTSKPAAKKAAPVSTKATKPAARTRKAA